MKIVLNGNETAIDGTCTVRDLLERRGLSKNPCAVEVNAELVPRSQHEAHRLTEGDRIEIVTLVGGG